MPVIIDLTVSEVSTEAATAEIAVLTVVVGVAVIVASLLVDRFTPAQRLAQVTALRAVRAAAVIVMFCRADRRGRTGRTCGRGCTAYARCRFRRVEQASTSARPPSSPFVRPGIDHSLCSMTCDGDTASALTRHTDGPDAVSTDNLARR